MKKNRNFFLGLILGSSTIGALVFLCLPFIVRDTAFLSGFIACVVLLSCLLTGIYLLKAKSGQEPGTEDSSKVKAPSLRKVIAFFFLLSGLLFVFLLFRQDEKIKSLAKMQRLQLAKQNELIVTTRNAGIVKWMSMVLQQAETELDRHPGRQLQDETIASIAALSYSFKPYHRVEEDSSMLKEISPERGMLLLALCRMNMDTVSMQKILMQSYFAHADLVDADLQSAFLQGADLENANLRDANLEKANFNQANLNSANLWGSTLRDAQLNGTQLKKADLSWADLSGASLYTADLHEASLISAQLRRADLRKAVLKWADFSSAFLDEADLSNADMFRSTLRRTQVVSANLDSANLSLAILSEANLMKTKLTDADLSGTYISDPQWLTRLHDWQVTGADDIQNVYEIVDGISHDGSPFQLKKK